MSTPDHARNAPAAARNRQPILDVLERVLPRQGTVLEVASGTGEHAVFFAAQLPHLVWQPTDPDPTSLQSIEAWRQSAALLNLLPAQSLDARTELWPVQQGTSAVVCINMIHIAPWEAAQGLMRGASSVLEPEGVLYLYGPFRVNGQHTAESNAAFDRSLRARDPSWGVRDRGEVQQLAHAYGFELQQSVAMPANNQSLVFRRRADA